MHKFRLVPGELVHIGGIPYGVADDGVHLEGGTDPAKARSWRDDVETESGEAPGPTAEILHYETETGRLYRPAKD